MIGKIILFLLCALLALLVIALQIPAYIRVRYEQGTFSAALKYAWLTIPLFPQEDAQTPQEKAEGDATEADSKKPTTKQKRKINRDQIRYTVDTLPGVLLKTLRRFGRGIRIEPLKVHVLVATPDPADTAILYGKIQAFLSAVLPTLHRSVTIREQDIQLFLDFNEESMDFSVDAGIGIRPGKVLLIAIAALGGILKWYFGFRKRADKTPQTNDNNRDTTAQAENAA